MYSFTCISLSLLRILYLTPCNLYFPQVTTELREVSVEDLSTFMDEFNHHIFDMVSSPDSNEKRGAILAIGELELTFESLSAFLF